MPIIVKSIYRRILSSFILIILFTVLLSSFIEYLSTKSELPQILTEIKTTSIASSLSYSYTRDRGWKMLKQEIQRLNSPGAATASEILSMRIIVRNSEGKTLYNSFTDLVQRDDTPLVEGESVHIYDYTTGDNVGVVTVYINSEFLDNETNKYILSIFTPRIKQGLITIFLIIFVAALLTRQITGPITVLSKAAERIAVSGDSQFIPVNSPDELGQLSNSFNQMISSLQKQRELRKRLISDVSHDINTPLNVIRLEAKGLSDKLISSEEAVVHIIDEVDRLGNLVHDLDWLGETDSGEFKLKLEESSIGDIVSAEVDRWRLKSQWTGISLLLNPISSDMPLLNLDVIKISQVLGNLLDNGFKYSSAGGLVTVTCCLEEREAVISVCDRGSGIDKRDLPYLFDRFYRVDLSREHSETGRGLGLSIVRHIVELHGGSVHVESDPGKGSCFYFTLPV